MAAESAIGDESETEEVDMTIGELYEIHEELSELEENVQAGEPIETIKEELEQKKEVKTEKKESSAPVVFSSGRKEIRPLRKNLCRRKKRRLIHPFRTRKSPRFRAGYQTR